jgi:hypothetical protein
MQKRNFLTLIIQPHLNYLQRNFSPLCALAEGAGGRLTPLAITPPYPTISNKKRPPLTHKDGLLKNTCKT